MDCHGGTLNDSRFGTRMYGEGKIAAMIEDLFRTAKLKYMQGRSMKPLNCTLFQRPEKGQLSLF